MIACPSTRVGCQPEAMAEALACTCANGGFGGCSCAASGRGDSHPADEEDQADSLAASIHPASGDSLAAESSAQGQLIPRGCPYRDVRLSTTSPSRSSTNSELRTAVQPRRDEPVQREPPGIQAIRDRRLCSGDIRLRRPLASSLPALTLSEAGDWFKTTHYVLLHCAEAVILRFVLRQWHEEAQNSNSGQGPLLQPF